MKFMHAAIAGILVYLYAFPVHIVHPSWGSYTTLDNRPAKSFPIDDEIQDAGLTGGKKANQLTPTKVA